MAQIAVGDTVTLKGGGWNGEVCEVVRIDGDGQAGFKMVGGAVYTSLMEFATPSTAEAANTQLQEQVTADGEAAAQKAAAEKAQADATACRQRLLDVFSCLENREIDLDKLLEWLASSPAEIDEQVGFSHSGNCGPEPKTTVLGYAVASKHKEACDKLINAGANPDAQYYVYLELGGGSKVLHDCKIREMEQWAELFP